MKSGQHKMPTIRF